MSTSAAAGPATRRRRTPAPRSPNGGAASSCRICSGSSARRCRRTIPGSLAPEDAADVVAYLLKMNAMPVGKDELPPDVDSLKQVRIEIKRANAGPDQRTTYRNEEEAMTRRWTHAHGDRDRGARRRARDRRCSLTHAHAVERASRARRSCAATSRANGATGARTRGARATRRSIRSTPRNFDSLQVAWQWNAGQYGEDEYYRTTPLFANGRLFTVATTRRKAFAHRSRDGQDALAVGHGRRHPLAEGAAPVRRPRARLLDRRRRTSASSSSRRAITSCRSTRRRASRDPKFGKDGIVDLMDGSRVPARAARRRRLRPEHHQRRPRRRESAKPGEKWNADDEDRRRRHDGHRSGATARSPTARRPSSSAT